VAWRAIRGLTVLEAVAFAVIGVPLFLAPDTAAGSFAWSVSPFVAMTIGAWCLGNAVLAAITARRWSIRLVYTTGFYLGLFGVFETAVVVAFRDKLALTQPLGWAYVATLVLTVATGVLGMFAWVTHAPRIAPFGRPVSRAQEAATVVFVVFVGSLAAYGFIGQAGGIGTTGEVFPEPLTLFSLRAFGAFYLALALGVLPLMREPSAEVALHHGFASYGLIVLITAAALVNFEAFDLVARPGGWLYLGAYLVVGAVVGLVLIRSGPGRPPRQ